jgi:predicted Rdx family selenoprotein
MTICHLLTQDKYAQELISTFGTSLGEVSLQPSIGGTFVVRLIHNETNDAATMVKTSTIWDRKTDGGFPETKELKRRVRNIIEPERDLGHVDRDHRPKKRGEDATKADESVPTTTEAPAADQPQLQQDRCEDCV